MKQVLIYENRKANPLVLDISTQKKRHAAFLYLFTILRDEWECYATGYWGDSALVQTNQKKLYALANSGDGAAAELLLKARHNYEYEEWSVVNVVDATDTWTDGLKTKRSK